MKQIKKIQKQEPKANTFVTVGEKVIFQHPNMHDGRNEWYEGAKVAMTVVKVNKVTFDGQDTEGNVYRIDVRNDRFQVAVWLTCPQTISSLSVMKHLSLTNLLTVLFVGLKLTGHIDWSWVWVLSPLWISAIISLVFIVIVGVIAMVTTVLNKK